MPPPALRPSSGRNDSRVYTREDIIDWEELPDESPAGPSSVVENSMRWPVLVLELEGTKTDTMLAIICFYQLLVDMWAWLWRM